MGNCVSARQSGKGPGDKSNANRRSLDTSNLRISILKAKMAEPIHSIDFSRLTQTYNLSKTVLGRGQFGQVFLAESIADPDFKVAIKLVKRECV